MACIGGKKISEWPLIVNHHTMANLAAFGSS
jgi:hypothetical protein